jgi:hypothetical protein
MMRAFTTSQAVDCGSPATDTWLLQASDGWEKTPGSVGPDVIGEYTDGKDHKDYNVFANGYKFPKY